MPEVLVRIVACGLLFFLLLPPLRRRLAAERGHPRPQPIAQIREIVRYRPGGRGEPVAEER